MDVFLYIAGAAIVCAALLDVFFTVLFPASGQGPIRKPLAVAVWQGFRFVAARTTGQRRRNILSYSGPVLITVTLAVWFVLLVTGGAMIYKPALGTAIRASSGPTDTGWGTALYFSGFNLTTLGVGDLAAATDPFRLLSVTQAAMGFSFFSLVITYFLSVYSSLTSRNAFAQGLHHLSGRTDDAAEAIARLAHGDELSDARDHLSAKADFLREIHQTHRFYPVLRHFHYREPHYALPQILLTALESATLIRSALDRERYAHVIDSPGLNGLFDAATDLMRELMPDAQPGPASENEATLWRERYRAALTRLADAGLHVRADAAAGADEYVALRAQWERPLQDLAAAMLHEWGASAASAPQSPGAGT